VPFRVAEGVRVESVGEGWVAYSALSGETLQLNTEAAAVLELLAQGPLREADICNSLANDAQTDVAEISEALRHVWDQLVTTGLVRVERDPVHNPW
jgi:PqqD family protein of HPr-rel-A system